MAFHVDAGLASGVGSDLDFHTVYHPSELHVGSTRLSIVPLGGNPVLRHIDRALLVFQARKLALHTVERRIRTGGGLDAGRRRIVLATGRQKQEGPDQPAVPHAVLRSAKVGRNVTRLETEQKKRPPLREAV